MSDTERFWDRLAERYAARPISDMAAYDLTIERTRAHLRATDRALEIGAGTGTTALRLADAVAHLTATDLSAKMIAIGRGKAEAAGVDNVAFRHASLRDAAGSDGPFDVVLAFNLLPLLDDLPGDLAAIHAMLKPGGRFISKSACLGGKGVHLRLLLWVLRRFGKAPDIRFLRAADLDARIAEAGFEIVETRDFPGVAAAHFIVARRRRG